MSHVIQLTYHHIQCLEKVFKQLIDLLTLNLQYELEVDLHVEIPQRDSKSVLGKLLPK